MIFLNALQSMVSITLLVFLGYMLAWKGTISREVEIFIPRFITTIVVPPYLMAAVVQHFDHDSFLRVVVESAVPFLSMVVVFFLFMLLGRLCRMDRKHLGLAATGAATSNTIFIGIPVNNALFGEVGLSPLLLYFLANSIFFWTFGNYAIASEGVHEGKRLSGKETLKRIFSPPLVGTLTGMALLLVGIPLPKFLLDSCNLLGALGSPLALIFVGVILRRIDWKSTHMGKDILLTLMGRVLLTPLVTIGVLTLFPMSFSSLTSHVYIVQAGLPSMTNIALISAYYGADKEFGSVFVCLSTIVGMITVPIWMTIVTYWM